MSNAAPMKIQIELDPWQVEILQRWNIPEEHSGPSVAERVAFMVFECCDDLRALEERRATHPREFEDDEVPL